MTDHPSEPTDETQPHEPAAWRPVERDPALAPTPSPAPSTPASYSPAPEPRTDWAQPRWADPEPTPEHWFESAPPPVARPVAVRPSARGAGAGTVVAAALAAAVLASGGTSSP